MAYQRQQQSRTPQRTHQRHCHFCFNNLNVVDYKDGKLLRKFMSSHGKIAPKRRSGCCSLHQRKLARAIKRARVMSVVPFLINKSS